MNIAFNKMSFLAPYRLSLGSIIFCVLKLGEQLVPSRQPMLRTVRSMIHQSWPRYVAEIRELLYVLNSTSLAVSKMSACFYGNREPKIARKHVVFSVALVVFVRRSRAIQSHVRLSVLLRSTLGVEVLLGDHPPPLTSLRSLT